MILFFNTITFSSDNFIYIMTFSVALGILEMIILRFSMQAEDVIEQAHDKFHMQEEEILELSKAKCHLCSKILVNL